MITEQQAREVVLHERSGVYDTWEREARIESIEQATIAEDDPKHHGVEMGHVEWEPLGWSVNFAYRDRQTGQGWSEWTCCGHCYVVEAKPGPYVLK
jgi:hypothetical protein